MNVVIVGAGYVGLVTGVCLASKGHKIFCVEKNKKIAASLTRGEPHIVEKGLPELLSQVVRDDCFVVATQLADVIQYADLVIISVGTPSSEGSIDLSSVRDACHEIGTTLRADNRNISVVMKSTVVPGTTNSIVRQILEESSGRAFPNFGLGVNPEFLREGDAISDFMNPDRIVIGFEDDVTCSRLDSLYECWNADKIYVNTTTAEMIKYVNNSLLAVQISTMNEMANLSSAIGNIDMGKVLEGVVLDKRWNPISSDGDRVNPEILGYLVPGCGFGGSCLPKDVEAIVSHGSNNGIEMKLLQAVLAINKKQPSQVLRIIRRYQPSLSGVNVLVLGLSFKQDTDDVRGSPSVEIIDDCISDYARVSIHDPIATSKFLEENPSFTEEVQVIEDWVDAARTSEIIIVVTKWSGYRNLASMNLKNKLVFDARSLFNKKDFPGSILLGIGDS